MRVWRTLAGAEECLSAAALFHLKIFLIKTRCGLWNVSDVCLFIVGHLNKGWRAAAALTMYCTHSVKLFISALPYLICTSFKGKPILLAAFSLLIILKLTLISDQCDLRLFNALLFSHWLYSGTSYRSKCCIFSHEKINSMYSANDYVLSWRLTTLVINNGGCTASVTAAGLGALLVRFVLWLWQIASNQYWNNINQTEWFVIYSKARCHQVSEYTWSCEWC